MGEPEVGREYLFVRQAGACFDFVWFTRFADGSARVQQGLLITRF
jgi:hypothetical protein